MLRYSLPRVEAAKSRGHRAPPWDAGGDHSATELLKILISSIEDRCLAVGGLAEERGTCRHGHDGN